MFLNIFCFYPNICFADRSTLRSAACHEAFLGQIVPDKVRLVQNTHQVLIFQLDTLSIRGSGARAGQCLAMPFLRLAPFGFQDCDQHPICFSDSQK
jgi:hypothetical protein